MKHNDVSLCARKFQTSKFFYDITVFIKQFSHLKEEKVETLWKDAFFLESSVNERKRNITTQILGI